MITQQKSGRVLSTKLSRGTRKSVFWEPLEQRVMLSVSPELMVQSSMATAMIIPAQQTIASVLTSALASGDPIYMKYGKITGDVTAKGYKGEIQLTSFEWALSAPASLGGSRDTVLPQVTEIRIGKTVDSASVPLIKEALVGTPTDVEIDFVRTVKGSLQTYLKLDLSSTLISSYSLGSNGERPTESLTLNFSKISFTAGKQSVVYDLTKVQSAGGLEALTSPAASSAIKFTGVSNPIYMKYGNITGDVTVKGFENASQLSSIKWAVSREIGSPIGTKGASRGSSVPQLTEVAIGKTFDSASVPLIQEAFEGTPSNVSATFVSPSGQGTLQTYLKLDLANTLVSSYLMSSGGGKPSESLSLNFTKISFTAGKQSFSYDLQKVDSAGSLTPLTTKAPTVGTGNNALYLKYGDIVGGSTAEKFKGSSNLTTLQWGVSRTIDSSVNSDGYRGISAPQVSEVNIGKGFDSASLPLIQEALDGSPSAVTTSFVGTTSKGSLQTYLKLDLANTLVSNYQMSSSGEKPSESLSLNYTKISFTAGKQTFSYDLQKADSAGSLTILPATSTPAATTSNPIYMKYGSIAGDVTAKGYLGDSQLTSIKWGISRSIGSSINSDGYREVSAPQISEVNIRKVFDSASVPLIKEAFSGTPSSVAADFTAPIKGTLQTYLKLELTDTLVSGYAMSSGGDRPSESLSLNFTKLSFTAGKQTFSVDLTKSQGAALLHEAPQAGGSATTSGGNAVYMKFGNITGDVTAKGYEKQTQLSSIKWSVDRPIGTNLLGEKANRESSRPQVSELTIGKGFDSASVPLIKAALEGTASPVMTNFVAPIKGSLQTYLKLDLADAIISNYAMNSGGVVPTESLTLNYTKISFTAGKQAFSLDLIKGQAVETSGTLALANPVVPTTNNPIYMKYDGLTGDVTAKGYSGDIQLTTFQWGISRSMGSMSNGRTSSPPVVWTVQVGKGLDSSSLSLMQNALDGKAGNIEIDFTKMVKGSLQTYFKLDLSDALISGYSMSSGGDRPSESLSLNFSKISFTAGTQTYKYDLTKSTLT